MRTIVFGAGAIGGFVAAALARDGRDVGVVARGAHLRAIHADGLRVRSERLGHFDVRLDASDDVRDLLPADVVVTAVKAHQMPGVAVQLLAAVSSGASLLTLSNGLPFWYFPDRHVEACDPGGRLRAAFDDSVLVGGVAHASGTILQPGTIAQMGEARYPIGEVCAGTSERVERIAATWRGAGLDVPVSPQIRVDVWRKLMGNVALNPISALTRATVHPILHEPATRSIVAAIMRETLAVAASTGIDVGIGIEERLALAERIADVKTSMLQDLEAGRPLELEPIAGAVVELARKAGVPAPHISMAYALTRMLAQTT